MANAWLRVHLGAMKDPMAAVRHHIDAFNRFTMAFRKLEQGWQIAASAWAKGEQ